MVFLYLPQQIALEIQIEKAIRFPFRCNEMNLLIFSNEVSAHETIEENVRDIVVQHSLLILKLRIYLALVQADDCNRAIKVSKVAQQPEPSLRVFLIRMEAPTMFLVPSLDPPNGLLYCFLYRTRLLCDESSDDEVLAHAGLFEIEAQKGRRTSP